MDKKFKCTKTFVEIRDMSLDGMTYKEIALQSNISRQRIEQILSPPKQIADKIRERAQGKCESCGIIIHKCAQLHHINNDKLAPSEYNDIGNIKYLCIGCHRKVHRINYQICQSCNQSFYSKSKKRFCSKSCKNNYYTFSAKCFNCGSILTVKGGTKSNELKWRVKRNTNIYCSHYCAGKSRFPKGKRVS